MKWLFVALGVIVAMLLAVVLTGALLPKQHTATRSGHYREPAAVIWQSVTDYNKFPEWRGSVARVEPLPSVNGKPAWVEYDKQNQRIPYEVVESSPPARFVTRIADPSLPFGGTWTMELTPDTTGSTLRITENGEVRNPIFRFVSRFILGPHATMDAYLKDLGAKFGETVTLQN